MKKKNLRKLALFLFASLFIGAVSGQKVGDAGPAGGVIFYAKQDYSDGWKYLEAAPADLDATIPWHNRDPITGDTTLLYIAVNETAVEIGSGRQNTMAIVEKLGSGNYAALACSRLTLNGYSDWYLPSKVELNCLFEVLNSNGIGDFKATRYWSSSETTHSTAWCQYFYSGLCSPMGKNVLGRVRPIRRF